MHPAIKPEQMIDSSSNNKHKQLYTYQVFVISISC